MPGIAGIIGNNRDVPWEAEVEKMVSLMRHEPFYTVGTHRFPEMGIYCGWVAHERSFASHQLFRNEQHTVALFLSGECFLDSSIETLLRQRGHSVDAKNGAWLVSLYLELGDRFFERLNGLFSGLLIDKQRGQAFLFTDRYGMERLYFHENDEAFYFASEAKALLGILPQLRDFDREGLGEFLKFGSTRGARTLFRGISTLPAASLWSFDGIKCDRQKYFSPQQWQSQPTKSSSAFSAELDETFRRILPRYFESETNAGISLTAGLDGRMIMSCLPKTQQRLVCHTFAGENSDLLDARLAGRVAAAMGLEHHVLRIRSDFFTDFGSIGDRTVYLTDGFLGFLGTHELYFNRQARGLAPVRITGVFGGEVLREVSFSKPLNLDRSLIAPGLAESLNHAQEDEELHPVTSAISREIPERRFGVIASGRSQTIFRTPYLDNELVALSYCIPPALRRSVHPAVAVIQKNSPAMSQIRTDMGFLGCQSGMLSFVNRMVGRISFKLDYFYDAGLPGSLAAFDPVLRGLKTSGLLGRHKFLHYRSWFRNRLATFVNGRIEEIATHGSDLWNVNHLRKIMREHFEGQTNRTQEISLVLTLEAVQRLLFGNVAQPEQTNTGLHRC